MDATQATPEVLADGTPARLGRYRLVRPISTGGMARVFEARRESLAGVAPRVAIKVILPEHANHSGFQRLFINEARIGSLLTHQNLVQIQDFDSTGDRFYLVMEFVEGVTLRRAISLCRRHGLPIPVQVIAEIGRQVCDGLHYAHTACAEDGSALHLVHRDIKPSNLMLNPQGVVKLLDFGISKALLTAERPGAVRGTWGYMAPEQAAGEEVTGLADLFGVAAVLYELASLQPLFPEKEPEVIRSLLDADEAARRAAALTGPLAPLGNVLVRALQRDPSARFSSASAMGRALGALVRDPVTARDQLVRFQQDLALRVEHGIAEARRGGGRTASTLSPSQASHSSEGLPLAVGDHRGPLPLDDRRAAAPAPSPEAGGLARAMPLVLLLVGAGIVGFTAWRLYAAPLAPPEPRVEAVPEGLSRLAEEPAATQAPPEAPPPVEVAPAPEPSTERTRPVGGTISVGPPAAEQAPATGAAAEQAPANGASAAGTTEPGGTRAVGSGSGGAAGGTTSVGSTGNATAGGGTVSLDPAESTASGGTVSLGSGSESAPAEVPAAIAVTISSVPRASVAVDGTPRGSTPVVGLTLEPGVHAVTLSAEDGRRATFKIEAVAGGTNRWIYDFERQGFR